jgi:hypothetical protein
MPIHSCHRWEKKLSDERQSYGATSVSPPGRSQGVTWGVPIFYFLRLSVMIFGTLRKNFNGTADICTPADYECPH